MRNFGKYKTYRKCAHKENQRSCNRRRYRFRGVRNNYQRKNKPRGKTHRCRHACRDEFAQSYVRSSEYVLIQYAARKPRYRVCGYFESRRLRRVEYKIRYARAQTAQSSSDRSDDYRRRDYDGVRYVDVSVRGRKMREQREQKARERAHGERDDV